VLAHCIGILTDKLIKGLAVNRQRLADNLENALLMATVHNPVLGYDRVAQITRKAAQEGLSPKAAAVALGFMTAQDYERLVRPELMVEPQGSSSATHDGSIS